MQKSGVLVEHKEIAIAPIVENLKRTARVLRWVGALFIGISLIGLIIVYGPLITAEVEYQVSQKVPMKPSKLGSALRDMPNWQVPDMAYSLYVPKINARAKVVGNVDAGNEKAYLQALTEGVAEAAGLSHPGQRGTTYLFAHSTDGPWNFARYNAVFYLLDKVEVGDQVEVVYRNRLFKYQIVSKAILAANDTRYLVPQTDREILVLQTCYPPGTSWKRLVVEAEPL